MTVYAEQSSMVEAMTTNRSKLHAQPLQGCVNCLVSPLQFGVANNALQPTRFPLLPCGHPLQAVA